jgi:hypothetical protein
MMENLDAMGADELMGFWYRHQNGRRARDIFPDGGKGTRKATDDLAAYASNKSAAIGCRLRGDIESALMYEGFCDRIYMRLPDFARW